MQPAPHRVILIILDGLAWPVAQQTLGYVQGLCAAGLASSHRLQCELPSLSRPLYECILTGSTPIQSGVTHNRVQRLSNQTSLFHLAQSAGLRTAAAAYHWISELYNRAPFEAKRDRLTIDNQLPIQYGLFYQRDDYPDDHVFLDAEQLVRRYQPDLLVVHPMNIDDAGHQHGLNSAAYRNSARQADSLLADFVPDWLAAGYQIVLTSDHGMNDDGSHGGTLTEERDVPLYLIGSAFNHASQSTPQQTELCGLCADLLAISHDKPRCPELLAGTVAEAGTEATAC
ncbi:alkaline phosphatase family protein [Atopomonas sediminilitoris]|uniref:alkaline phosphatase family protein n=1 Tax=Atopomonas sediminilitoris TaxID=2919919 RepID=UPI001F4DCB31|nr:alkaline phosphatase family protein [Atopomonas sediminilitoris]MCJ8169865.1 alkaline phosphatase family protein [Atopomonas sediminilitoris]